MTLGWPVSLPLRGHVEESMGTKLSALTVLIEIGFPLTSVDMVPKGALACSEAFFSRAIISWTASLFSCSFLCCSLIACSFFSFVS